MEYDLELSIDTDSLRVLKAAQMKVVLAKPVNDPGAAPNAVWLVFDPFEQNSVQWREEYGLYASNTAIANRAMIQKMSQVKPPATDQASYSFNADATFTGPFTGGDTPKGTFAVGNNMPTSSYPSLTFGLMQNAVVNNIKAEFKPVNAATVPAGTTVSFTPLTTIWVWLQADLVSGTVLTSVVSKAYVATFGGSKSTISLAYDPSRGGFAPAGPDKTLLASPTSEIQGRFVHSQLL